MMCFNSKKCYLDISTQVTRDIIQKFNDYESDEINHFE